MGIQGEAQEKVKKLIKYRTILKVLFTWVFSILTSVARSSATGSYAKQVKKDPQQQRCCCAQPCSADIAALVLQHHVKHPQGTIWCHRGLVGAACSHLL